MVVLKYIRLGGLTVTSIELLFIGVKSFMVVAPEDGLAAWFSPNVSRFFL
jgi:hypothetical protein